MTATAAEEALPVAHPVVATSVSAFSLVNAASLRIAGGNVVPPVTTGGTE